MEDFDDLSGLEGKQSLLDLGKHQKVSFEFGIGRAENNQCNRSAFHSWLTPDVFIRREHDGEAFLLGFGQ